jgi:hypothetical protein
MPVIRPDPPMASRVELAALSPSGTPELFTLKDVPALSAPPGDLLAHRSYVMTADSAALGTHPGRDARYLGWRYVVAADRGPGVATIHEHPERNAHVFGAYDLGPYAGAAPGALRALIVHADTFDREFEIRFLGLPALYLEAGWLRDAEGGDDFLLPFGLVPEGLSADTIYPVDAWIALLRPVAARVLAIAAEFDRGR